MKPREFLQVAVELSRSAQPARLRTAISRAYYEESFPTAGKLKMYPDGDPRIRPFIGTALPVAESV